MAWRAFARERAGVIHCFQYIRGALYFLGGQVKKQVKRLRGKQTGPTTRLYVTMPTTHFAMLQAQSEKVGITTAAVARQVIARALADGLGDDTSPSPYEELLQTYIDQQDTWMERVERADQKNDELLEALHDHTKVIVKQAKELARRAP